MISVVVEDAFEQIKNIDYWRGLWTPMAQLQYRYQETLHISSIGAFNEITPAGTAQAVTANGFGLHYA